MARKILILEDDTVTGSYLKQGLEEAGYVVNLAVDGPNGLHLATEQQHDVIILDRMLPGIDGLSVLRALRALGSETPILLLSALSTLDERVKGLNEGADDYMVKPFGFSELLARIGVLLRRKSNATPVQTKLVCADLEMDLLAHKVTRGGQVIDLQPREFRLLEFLLRHKDQVVTRTLLLENVWDYYFDPQTNVIDVHVSRLRQHIDKNFSKPLIHTLRGVGYMLSADR